METKIISSDLRSFLTPQQLKCISWTFRHFRVVYSKSGLTEELNFDRLVYHFGLACSASMCFIVAEANLPKEEYHITLFKKFNVKFYPYE